MPSTEAPSKDQLDSSLSALMDGEVTELELRRLLKSDNNELQKRWLRYNLASAAMRGELDAPVSVSQMNHLSSSISDAIAKEPNLSERAKTSSLWSSFARFGVAASVAGAIVVGVQLVSLDRAADFADTTASKPVSSAASEPVLDSDTSVRVVSQENRPAPKAQRQPIIINEATQQKLQQMESEINRLILEHSQSASQHSQQGVLPYVRVPESE